MAKHVKAEVGRKNICYPKWSMGREDYGIFTYIYHKIMPNVDNVFHTWSILGIGESNVDVIFSSCQFALKVQECKEDLVFISTELLGSRRT